MSDVTKGPKMRKARNIFVQKSEVRETLETRVYLETQYDKRRRRYHVTLWRFRVTILATEKQKMHFLCIFGVHMSLSTM